jgi:SAM-dependent methyltransferase
VADVYERGRPEFPPAVVGVLAAELHLPPDAQVLDLAAGTGKFTRALVEFGLDVIAVEPQDALREVLAAKIGAERVREGFAEAIPLPDDSLDAVTVADAFHWFDHGPALAEIRRVLRPGGGLVLVNNAPDWRAGSWAEEVGKIMEELRDPEHPGFAGPGWQEILDAAGGWSKLREVTVTANQPGGAERFLAYIASVSWVAALPDEERGEMLARVAAIVAAGETPSEISVQTTVAFALSI